MYFQELPGPIVDDPGKGEKTADGGGDADMKIAWRYQNMPQVQVNKWVVLFMILRIETYRGESFVKQIIDVELNDY